MNKAIELAKKLVRHPDENHLELLKDNNLFACFRDIYKMKGYTITDQNRMVAFIIFAYDPDSERLDLKKDRYDNKLSIARSVSIDVDSPVAQIFMKDILHNTNEDINKVVASYLHELTDWRWQTVFTLMDYHSDMMRFAQQKTDTEKKFDKLTKDGDKETMSEDYDIDKIAKVNQQKGVLIKQAIEHRREADALMSEIKKDFVHTDNAVQADFGFMFSDSAMEKSDIMSWKQWITNRSLKTK